MPAARIKSYHTLHCFSSINPAVTKFQIKHVNVIVLRRSKIHSYTKRTKIHYIIWNTEGSFQMLCAGLSSVLIARGNAQASISNINFNLLCLVIVKHITKFACCSVKISWKQKLGRDLRAIVSVYIFYSWDEVKKLWLWYILECKTSCLSEERDASLYLLPRLHIGGKSLQLIFFKSETLSKCASKTDPFLS